MKILILGSGGFIGQNLLKYLAQKGHACVGADVRPSENPSCYKIDILKKQLEWLLEKEQPEYIINASGSGNVQLSITDPKKDRKLNVATTEAVLQAMVRSASKARLIHISSAAVYGNPHELPISEAQSDVSQPISPYGMHKLESERMVQHYYREKGISALSIRIFSCFGEGQKKLLLWDLYQKLNARKSDEITLFGTGLETRDYIHIEDVAQVINLLMRKGSFTGDSYNVANGKEISVREIATQFIGLFDPEIQIVFNGQQRSGDPERWCASIKKISALGYVQGIRLGEGLARYKHYLDNLSKQHN